MSLNQKHALVTGSSRGIGRGIALRLAAGGARVAVHYYQNEAAAHDTLAQVRELGSDGFALQADVTRPEEIRGMFDRVRNEFGGLDIFRNWHKRGWTPMGRLGTPADIGNVVALLCSADAGWITGQVIYADGGAFLMSPEVPPEIQFGG